MIDRLSERTIDKLSDSAAGLLDLFKSDVQNIFMKKRFEKAKRAIESIKSGLEDYGLKVDYKKYFEDKLQVPLVAIEALSEVETSSQYRMIK